METLKGLARILNKLADNLEEKDCGEVIEDTSLLVKEDPNTLEDNLNHVRERSDSVDSGIAEYDLDHETGLEVISLEEVSYHCTMEDGWMVLYDKVYDVTDYLMSHPGGEDVMLEYLGYDATMAFRGVGHSRTAARLLDKFLIGILPAAERLNLAGP